MDANVSSWRPQPDFVALTSSILLFCLCILGLMGNCLSIVVFSQNHFRTLSINILLLALSISDVCLLLLAVPVFVSGPLLRCWPFWTNLRLLYTFCLVFLYPLTMIFHCCSIWLLIVVTFDRWVAVCRPLLVPSYCTRERAILQIVSILAASTIFNAVRFFDYALIPHRTIPRLLLRANSTYVLLYINASTLCVVYFLPLSILILLNWRIKSEIKRAGSIRNEMTRAQKDTRQTSRMLLYIVVCFICCYAPCFIFNVTEAVKPQLFLLKTGYILSDFNNASVLFNAATTFLFYLRYSTRYRKTAKLLITHAFCKAIYNQLLLEGENQKVYFALVQASSSVTRSRRSASMAARKHSKYSSHLSARSSTRPSRKPTLATCFQTRAKMPKSLSLPVLWDAKKAICKKSTSVGELKTEWSVNRQKMTELKVTRSLKFVNRAPY